VQILGEAMHFLGEDSFRAKRFVTSKQILNAPFFQATLTQSNIVADRSDPANSIRAC
jgi:hypothetical protein